MNAFELFCLVYFLLDRAWDRSRDDELGQYLSDADPFIWEDEGSADPAIYSEFIQRVPKDIDVDGSYEIAKRYVKSLDSTSVLNAFETVSPEQWLHAVKRYLAQEHKGGEARQI